MIFLCHNSNKRFQLWITWSEWLREDHFIIMHCRSETLEFRRNLGAGGPTRL